MSQSEKGRSYAGIGSRSTPEIVLQAIEHAGYNFADVGLILRSGGADGADTAFENGAKRGNGTREIFLPWPRFNNNLSPLYHPSKEAFEMTKHFHPAWKRLSRAERSLMARNCHQVLGEHLDDPVLFVLCWTPDGKGKGGTGQAIRIAHHHQIPVFDMGDRSLDQIEMNITEILQERGMI